MDTKVNAMVAKEVDDQYTSFIVEFKQNKSLIILSYD